VVIEILIVDDEPRIRSSLEGLLRDEGYITDSCDNGEKAVELIEDNKYDAVLLDVILPGMNGLETLEKIRKRLPELKVLMMSGQADLSIAVQATRLGAYDFFEKPLNPDRVLIALKNIAQQVAIEQRVSALESFVEIEKNMIGNSPAMNNLRKAIEKAAPTDGRVVIFGENGTGKELVARAVHELSRRKHLPFVSLNCAALPRDLVESELFGYEKGAFTGAVRKKSGRFEEADGGTLFLDEVGDMSLDTQAKLLRVLQESEAVRLGGNKPYRFDVRIISATNKDLKTEIKTGCFREDLFYRLNVIPIEIPPLRDRKEDIPPLAAHFLHQLCMKTGKGMMQWGRGSDEALCVHDWPGNVRELKNFVERLIIMGESEIIDPGEIVRLLPGKKKTADMQSQIWRNEDLSFREMLDKFEKATLIWGYQETKGNVSELARKFKLDRANLHRKLKQFGIK